MSDNVGSVIFKSGLVENVGVQVEIASLSQAVQKLLPLPFFRPPSWISGGRRGPIFSRMAPLKSPYPKMGVDTGIVSLSGRWAKLEGVQICTPPPRCWRYKKGSAVRGLINDPRGSETAMTFELG